MTEKDRFTPTQDLVLGVLAARLRLGETLWTFSTKCAPAIRGLEELGLVNSMHGITEHTIRASLTPAGAKEMLSTTYLPPAFRDAAETMRLMIHNPSGAATRTDLLRAVERLGR